MYVLEFDNYIANVPCDRQTLRPSLRKILWPGSRGAPQVLDFGGSTHTKTLWSQKGGLLVIG